MALNLALAVLAVAAGRLPEPVFHRSVGMLLVALGVVMALAGG